MSEDLPELPAGLAVGSRIAGYRLEEQIGRGGMSVVYRARDERLDRQVALKILTPGLAADVGFRERFIRESRAAAAVEDPHIIPVFEAGEASGALFIAMRLVRGGDIRSLLRQSGPLPSARAAEIISQVASALDAAHAHGLVHRDVKPGNMLLAVTQRSGQLDHVYLTDFGLSKGSLAVSGLTQTGQFLGTLSYISPEQIAGRPVDGRADQYALACTAFELLSGEPPFPRDEPTAVMYAHLSDPPPLLSSRRPDLALATDAVFSRALQKAPEARYGTCGEFAAALALAMLSRPAASAGSGVGTQAWPGPAAGPDKPSSQSVVAGSGAPATQIRSKPATTPGLTEQAAGPPGWTGGPAPAGPARPGRSRALVSAMIAAVVVVLLAVGGGAAYLALHHNHAVPRSQGKTRPHHGSTAPPLRTVALTPPQCGTATGPGRSFTVSPQVLLTVPAPPYGAIVTPDLAYTFIALPSAIEVLRNRAGIPVGPPVNTIAIPDHPHAQAITSDGLYLITATDHGATIIRISAAEQPGGTAAVVGQLASGLPGNPGGDDLALSTDNRFVFIAMRYADKVGVFDLAKALRSHFRSSGPVGYFTAGVKPHGMAVSGDGRWLYVASRFARPGSLEGLISVISVAGAEVNPSRAVVSSAIAGCGAYRVITSPDGSVLWVIAQSSDYLVGFSASKLRTDPKHALVAKVAIGATPLDEVLVRGGTRLLITDNSGADLSVVDPAVALAGGKHALVGYIKTSSLPRFFAFEPDGPVVLLVNGTSSGQIQALKVDDLP